MVRFGSERGVQAEKIGQRKKLIDFFDQLDLKRARPARGKIGIVSQDPHPEGDGAPAQLGADPAHADDAERFVVKLGPFELFSVPFPGLEVGMGLRDFARDRNEEGEGVLGGRDGVATRRVHDDNPAAGGRLDVDVVDPDAGAADDAQAGGGLQDGGGDFGLAAHDDGAEVRDQLHELRFALAGADHDLEVAADGELFDPALGDGIGDEDFRHAHF